MAESNFIEHTYYAVFFPESNDFLIGSARNTSRGNINRARLFPREHHAKSSITSGKFNAVVVPVLVRVDPKQMFTAVLKGVPRKKVEEDDDY